MFFLTFFPSKSNACFKIKQYKLHISKIEKKGPLLNLLPRSKIAKNAFCTFSDWKNNKAFYPYYVHIWVCIVPQIEWYCASWSVVCFFHSVTYSAIFPSLPCIGLPHSFNWLQFCFTAKLLYRASSLPALTKYCFNCSSPCTLRAALWNVYPPQPPIYSLLGVGEAWT